MKGTTCPDKIKRHIDKCEFRKKCRCKYIINGCMVKGDAEMIKEHILDCKYEAKCEYNINGCTFVSDKKTMDEHSLTCKYQAWCTYKHNGCLFISDKKTTDEHILICKYEIRCMYDYNGCPYIGDRKSTAEHMIDCLYQKWCPYKKNGCPVRSNIKTVDGHIIYCKYKKEACNYCLELFTLHELPLHQYMCGLIVKKCDLCYTGVSQSLLSDHYSSCVPKVLKEDCEFLKNNDGLTMIMLEKGRKLREDKNERLWHFERRYYPQVELEERVQNIACIKRIIYTLCNMIKA